MIHSRDRAFTGRIDISALIDVSLVLLIVLMTQSYLVGHPVTLPPEDVGCGPPPAGPAGCPIVLRLDRFGHMFIGKERLERADFAGRLRNAMQGRGGKPVFFTASKSISYGQVLDFMDLCRRNGARKLALVLYDAFEDRDL